VAVWLGHGVPLSVALGRAELERGAVIRAHTTEKRAAAHGVYALTRQLGGGLDDGLLYCYARRGSEACCARLCGEWLVRGIPAMQRR
jgi:hypothetical protein